MADRCAPGVVTREGDWNSSFDLSFFFSFLPEDVASTFRAASVGFSCQQKGPASLPPPVSVQRKWTAARDLHITDTRGTCGARD